MSKRSASALSRALAAWVAPVVLAGGIVPILHADGTPVGLWQQRDDRKGDVRSVIRIEQVGDELIGTIVQAFPRPGEPTDLKCIKCPGEFKDKPIVGLRFMWGLKGQGRAWDGGRVLDPDDGKIYRVKLRLADDGRTLEVRGYVGFSMLGRSQTWQRAEQKGAGAGGSSSLRHHPLARAWHCWDGVARGQGTTCPAGDRSSRSNP